jgi:hypothetical protein
MLEEELAGGEPQSAGPIRAKRDSNDLRDESRAAGRRPSIRGASALKNDDRLCPVMG